MAEKTSGSIMVLDKTSRRRFIRTGSGMLLAGAAVVSGVTLAADCDQGGERTASSDQDEGAQADRKQCQSRNIVSEGQPEHTGPVRVKKVSV